VFLSNEHTSHFSLELLLIKVHCEQHHSDECSSKSICDNSLVDTDDGFGTKISFFLLYFSIEKDSTNIRFEEVEEVFANHHHSSIFQLH
jgi:hypothetical protein